MKMLRHTCLLNIFVLFFMIGFAAAGPNPQGGERLHELFSDVSPSISDQLQMKQAPKREDPTIVRSRYVRVNFDLLKKAEAVVLNLLPDLSQTAVRERVEKRSEGRYSWFGRIEGKDHSSVVLTVEDGNMAGNIIVDGKTYQVRSVADGIHAVHEFDQSALPLEAPPVEVPAQEIDGPLPSAPQLDSADTIDILVVYTDDVAAASFNIASEIQLAIDETNGSYQNSGINQRLRLVRTEEVDYFETGNMSGDLSCIRSKTDGCLDTVHAWRDDAGADMVGFWVENGGAFCGIAYLMTSVSGSFESNAFSVTDRQCATGNYTFGHELGHNMGARHDRYVDSTDGSPFFFNHGYVNADPLDPWRTVMAYNTRCTNFGFSCQRLQYWSNPNKNFNGVPMGVPEGQFDAADNRKTLNNTALTVANFRQSQGTKFVDVPPGYWAEAAIYEIFNAGITTGCAANPLRYCPEAIVTRAQMAVFLGKAIHGSNYTPPTATGVYDDVPVSYWAADWIEQFFNDGITTGCGTNPLRYCPENPVTRAQMAIFLLRSKHGSSYTPPAASGIFADVPVTHWAADWIEQLNNEGITTGCQTNPLRYCPNSTVTRAQMAVFITRTFNL